MVTLHKTYVNLRQYLAGYFS